MPAVKTSQDSDDQENDKNDVKNRRASLPHNTKIPEIKITPSTPPPDEESSPSLELCLSKESSQTFDESDNDIVMLEGSTEDLDSTPDLDVVLASAKTDEDRRRVENFRKTYNL